MILICLRCVRGAFSKRFHHCYKFQVVDFSVPVDVNARDYSLDFLFFEREVVAFKHLAKLIPVNCAVSVFVEEAERCSQLRVLQVAVRVQASSDEFCVVNKSVAVRVNHLHCVENVFLAQVDVRDLFQSLL